MRQKHIKVHIGASKIKGPLCGKEVPAFSGSTEGGSEGLSAEIRISRVEAIY